MGHSNHDAISIHHGSLLTQGSWPRLFFAQGEAQRRLLAYARANCPGPEDSLSNQRAVVYKAIHTDQLCDSTFWLWTREPHWPGLWVREKWRKALRAKGGGC